eukprot:CAMPEP_0172913484 /NCGR_PEP_ID=MMETSP1075-20121228/190464_1 /TAXON_ID=2916 /ORGANISM="Ceratium fusus, Strain PA161109" /LENGTH=238 /DNA_ID=CAMNT_0013772203 /DNA_START=504 /DNA_END=1221 /DNA_ORIENTATION=-
MGLRRRGGGCGGTRSSWTLANSDRLHLRKTRGAQELAAPAGNPWHYTRAHAPRGLASTVPVVSGVFPQLANLQNDPSGDGLHGSPLLEHAESAVRSVDPNHGESVHALFPTNLLKVDAVYTDGFHLSLALSCTSRIFLRFDCLHNIIPQGRKLSAVTAPFCEEIDDGKFMVLNYMLEALVLEAIMGVGPICIEFCFSVFLFQVFEKTFALQLVVISRILFIPGVAHFVHGLLAILADV